MNDKTTIKLSKKTRDRLASHGGKDDTFEDILKRILDFYEENKEES